MTIGVIDELSDSDKIPAFYGKTAFGVGRVAQTALPLKLLLVGLADSAGSGTITPDGEPVQIFSKAEALTYAGSHSQLYCMASACLEQTQDIEVWLAAPTATATAATMTITVGGSWTTSGSFKLYVGGQVISIDTVAADTVTTVGDQIAAKINAKAELPATGVNAVGVVTATWGSKGTCGNTGIVFKDTTLIASGMTITLGGGGGAVTGDSVTGNGIYFVGGTGTEDITALLATLEEPRFERIAIGQNDATNLALWETQVDEKAGYAIGKMEHVVCAVSGNQATAVSRAQTTLNNWRFQLVWLEDSEAPFPNLAAAMAAHRVLKEQSQLNSGYDNQKLIGILPQRDMTKWPNRSVLNAVLSAGVTPIKSTQQGEALVVRAITTRSLTATGDPDETTLDTADAVVPDGVRDLIRIWWTAEFLPANPYVRDNPPEVAREPLAGVAFPRLAETSITERVLIPLQLANTLQDVADNPPVATFNPVAKRIAVRVPTLRLALQHQIEALVQQLAA